MKKLNLLEYKHNTFSQNGEDGIIERIFSVIGTTGKVAVEFGAWDGIHLSNIRKLILAGWTGVFIEGDKERYEQAVANYSDNPSVHSINSFVDGDKNTLSKILHDNKLGELAKNMDFLSIDIDGLDNEIFATLDISPRVICVEVNAGHSPLATKELPREVAIKNIGQPLPVFNKIAAGKKYSLACFNGNAFYIRNDVRKEHGIESISSEEAYEAFIEKLSRTEREWLYLVNLGLVPPHWNYKNPLLSARSLGIPAARASALRVKTRSKNLLYGAVKKIIR